MQNKKIGFIGGGNMATSLVGGLIADGVAAEQLWVSDPDAEKCTALSDSFGIHAVSDNQTLSAEVDVLVLAVKPQAMRAVCEDLAETVSARKPLVVSIAAGIREADLQRWLGGDLAIVRCMPNTPALLQCGATGLYAGAGVSEEQRSLAESILRAAGLTLWVAREELIDAVTAVSGSGPAYFFLVMEAMVEAGEKLGLEADSARLLALQTSLGAARMALESDVPPEELRRRVTSPGGTTERAIGILEEGGLRELFDQALKGARDRSIELSEMMGQD